MAELTKRGIGYLTRGERTIELPEDLMMEVMDEAELRGGTRKTGLIVELLWEAIRKKKREHVWHTESK